MRRREVLWISTRLSTRGGVASYVREMQATPLWQRWSIRHVATHQDGSAVAKILRFALGSLQVWYLLAARRPAVVHLHMGADGSFVRKALLAWSARAVHVPVVLHVHSSHFDAFHDRLPRLGQQVVRRTLEMAACVIALGPAWGQQLQRVAPRAHLLVVPNAVRLVPPRPARSPAAGDPVRFVFLGRLGERKGVPELLEAWEGLVDPAPAGGYAPVHLVLAGDGEVEQARHRVQEGALAGSVEVPGWVSVAASAELLDRADVFVLPSHQEGQPMAVLEAMSRGLCVVSTRVGGIPDMVTDGESGVLVEPGDPAALAAALRRVGADAELRHRLGTAARERVEREFDREVVWRQLDALYERLTAS